MDAPRTTAAGRTRGLPSSSSSLLSSTSPSMPLLEGPLLERDWREEEFKEEMRVWERLPSAFLNDT